MSSINPISPEQRQHINLSQYAFDVVQNDALTFMGKINNSGFICRILYNCGESFFDEVDLRNITYSKDVPLKIRLNNDVIDDYYPTDGEWFGAKHRITQGEYIKALLEQYARMPFFDRESIFYKQTILTINNHIDNTDPHKGILPIIYQDGNKYYIKPYRLSFDYEAQYHYLICISTKDPNEEMRPASFRLTRIKGIKQPVTSYGTGMIKSKESKELERRIKENGVPYIFGDTMDYVVKLTTAGLDMYNSIFHQRPIYTTIQKEEQNTYYLTFHSTERQITNYFFQFGKEAMIVSPDKTRDWIRNRYEAALESYDQSSLSV